MKPRRRRIPIAEKAIHAAVIDHLKKTAKPGVLFWTNANMGAMGQAGLTKGVPDITIHGPQFEKTRYLELKREGGQLSPEQEAVIKSLRSLGFDVAVTEGREEPIIALEAWGVVHARAVQEGRAG